MSATAAAVSLEDAHLLSPLALYKKHGRLPLWPAVHVLIVLLTLYQVVAFSAVHGATQRVLGQNFQSILFPDDYAAFNGDPTDNPTATRFFLFTADALNATLALMLRRYHALPLISPVAIEVASYASTDDNAVPAPVVSYTHFTAPAAELRDARARPSLAMAVDVRAMQSPGDAYPLPADASALRPWLAGLVRLSYTFPLRVSDPAAAVADSPGAALLAPRGCRQWTLTVNFDFASRAHIEVTWALLLTGRCPAGAAPGDRDEGAHAGFAVFTALTALLALVYEAATLAAACSTTRTVWRAAARQHAMLAEHASALTARTRLSHDLVTAQLAAWQAGARRADAPDPEPPQPPPLLLEPRDTSEADLVCVMHRRPSTTPHAGAVATGAVDVARVADDDARGIVVLRLAAMARANRRAYVRAVAAAIHATLREYEATHLRLHSQQQRGAEEAAAEASFLRRRRRRLRHALAARLLASLHWRSSSSSERTPDQPPSPAGPTSLPDAACPFCSLNEVDIFPSPLSRARRRRRSCSTSGSAGSLTSRCSSDSGGCGVSRQAGGASAVHAASAPPPLQSPPAYHRPPSLFRAEAGGKGKGLAAPKAPLSDDDHAVVAAEEEEEEQQLPRLHAWRSLWALVQPWAVVTSAGDTALLAYCGLVAAADVDVPPSFAALPLAAAAAALLLSLLRHFSLSPAWYAAILTLSRAGPQVARLLAGAAPLLAALVLAALVGLGRVAPRFADPATATMTLFAFMAGDAVRETITHAEGPQRSLTPAAASLPRALAADALLVATAVLFAYVAANCAVAVVEGAFFWARTQEARSALRAARLRPVRLLRAVHALLLLSPPRAPGAVRATDLRDGT